MKILVVDDELSMREYLEILVSRWGYEVALAATADAGIESLERDAPDLVISDMKLGNDSGLRVLKAARARTQPPEVIIITAFGTPASAIEAIREGAYDYITKPFDNEELKLLVERALEKRQIRLENAALRRSIGGNVIRGSSRAMDEVWAMVDKVAASPRATVLITGESGTGKEVVARAIHNRSSRATQPFIPINCGALGEGVLESELFGHVKGAFTGAINEHTGLMVSAGQGTVFLDEIGEISPALQVKLLRVLQERMVRPVGSSRELPVEARLMAATNKSLEAEAKAGRFREDLYYRLNVITVDVPALRLRSEDIPQLATSFLARAADELGRPGLHFDQETIEVLSRYRFPGNVRQLQNIVERAATLADSDLLGVGSLPPSVRGEEEKSDSVPAPSLSAGFSLEKHLDEMERGYLREAIRRAGTKVKAAELLGLSFRSFRYRLAKHGLE
ncbi:MAG: sigma-54-dependent Fis family transcriptional regulator [Archangiaceae bacterium]|nr:sigma-54-dependent Fis family transcriptional regulator [Archangiaceae bacterium]